jgi:hypothetical protein
MPVASEQFKIPSIQLKNESPLQALHDIFLCRQSNADTVKYAADSWFRLDTLKTFHKEHRDWKWLDDASEKTMAIVHGGVTWGWAGDRGKHTATTVFTFIRIAL